MAPVKTALIGGGSYGWTWEQRSSLRISTLSLSKLPNPSRGRSPRWPGDCGLALRALCNDPLVNGFEVVPRMREEMPQVNREYPPRFFKD